LQKSEKIELDILNRKIKSENYEKSMMDHFEKLDREAKEKSD